MRCEIFLVKNYIKLSVQLYLKEVFFKAFFVSIAAFIFPYVIYSTLSTSLLRLLLVTITSIISSLFTIYLLGTTDREKDMITNIIKKKFIQKK